MTSVLWVTAIEPRLDGGGGGQIRQGHLLAALADRFSVSLLLAGRLSDGRIRERLASLREVPASPTGDAKGALRRRLRTIRWELLERQSEEIARQRGLRRALGVALAAMPPTDIVCVEYIGLAPLLPRERHGLWTITLHNLPSEMAEHTARLTSGRRQRAMLWLEARNSRRVEQWAAQAYDLAVTVAPEDAAALPPGVVVVPNGVDTDRVRPSPLPTAHRIVFTGALHTLPNRDGIEWFCHAVWPLIRSRVPGVELDIVGSRPTSEVLALRRIDGVEVHPDVPDVLPYFERARVAVVPLRIGSGSRLKALEAMAAGRPVVGTTIGLGGLEVEPGEIVLVADQEEKFADAVVRCLEDEALAARLASRARAEVAERYSWSQIGADYAALLDARTPARAR